MAPIAQQTDTAAGTTNATSHVRPYNHPPENVVSVPTIAGFNARRAPLYAQHAAKSWVHDQLRIVGVGAKSARTFSPMRSNTAARQPGSGVLAAASAGKPPGRATGRKDRDAGFQRPHRGAGAPDSRSAEAVVGPDDDARPQGDRAGEARARREGQDRGHGRRHVRR